MVLYIKSYIFYMNCIFNRFIYVGLSPKRIGQSINPRAPFTNTLMKGDHDRILKDYLRNLITRIHMSIEIFLIRNVASPSYFDLTSRLRNNITIAQLLSSGHLRSVWGFFVSNSKTYNIFF